MDLKKNSVKLFPSLINKDSEKPQLKGTKVAKNKTPSSHELDGVFGEIFPDVLSTRPPPVTQIVGEREPHIFLGFNASNVVLDGPDTGAAGAKVPSSSSRPLSPQRGKNPTSPTFHLQFQTFEIEERVEGKAEENRESEEALLMRKRHQEEKQGVDEDARSYVKLMDEYSLHNFIVWNGEAQKSTPEFQSFLRTYEKEWAGMNRVLSALELHIKSKGWKLVIVRGGRLAKLAKLNHMSNNNKLDVYALEGCIEKVGDKGATFQPRKDDEDENDLYAVRCQRYTRGYLGRVHVKRLREERERQQRAAVHIQKEARRFIQTCYKLPMRLMEAKEDRETFFRTNLARLQDMWRDQSQQHQHLQKNQKVIVVVPSLSFEELARINLSDYFGTLQNLLVPYIHLLSDPDLHLAYITPIQIGQVEMLYHERLLALMGISLTPQRLHFFTPELARVMPAHTDLAQNMWFSTSLLRKVRRLIKGKRALLVSAMEGWAERRIAHYLQLPVLGSAQSNLHQQLRTSSFARNIFQDANVNTPMGSAHVIYSKDDMLVALTTLVSNFLDTDKWTLRLNCATQGNRPACTFNVSKLNDLHVLRRKLRNGEIEIKKDTSFRDYQLVIMKEVMSILTRNGGGFIKCTTLSEEVGSWPFLFKLLKTYGGVVEAEPPSGSKPRVLYGICFISPEGNVTCDRGLEALVGDNGFEHAVVCPQQAVSDAALQGATTAVANTLWDRHRVVGYVTVQFISFEDRSRQFLWAKGLSLGVSSPHATIGALRKTQRPGLTPTSDFIDASAAAHGSERLGGDDERAFIHIPITTSLQLVGVRDDLFFKLCGMHGMSWDQDTKTGLLFFLGESVVAGRLNFVAVAKDLGRACEMMSECCSFIQGKFTSTAAGNLNNATDDPYAMGTVALTVKKAVKMFQTPLNL